MILRALRAVVWTCVWVLALGCAAWAFGALYYDFPVWKPIVAWVFVAVVIAAVVFLGRPVRKLAARRCFFAIIANRLNTPDAYEG